MVTKPYSMTVPYLVDDREDYGGLPGGGGPGPQLARGGRGERPGEKGEPGSLWDSLREEDLMVSTSTATPDSMRGWHRMEKVTSSTFLDGAGQRQSYGCKGEKGGGGGPEALCGPRQEGEGEVGQGHLGGRRIEEWDGGSIPTSMAREMLESPVQPAMAASSRQQTT